MKALSIAVLNDGFFANSSFSLASQMLEIAFFPLVLEKETSMVKTFLNQLS